MKKYYKEDGIDFGWYDYSENRETITSKSYCWIYGDSINCKYAKGLSFEEKEITKEEFNELLKEWKLKYNLMINEENIIDSKKNSRDIREQYKKETGLTPENTFQECANCPEFENGFTDEYAEWLESKLNYGNNSFIEESGYIKIEDYNKLKKR